MKAITGSETFSKAIAALFPSGVTHGKFTVEFSASPVAATEKRATNNLLSLESLCFALVKSGVVAKSNLANILSLAAESKNMDAETAALVEATIAEVKAKVETTLPMVPVAASFRVKGTAAVAA
jgi:hypothetical protein